VQKRTLKCVSAAVLVAVTNVAMTNAQSARSCSPITRSNVVPCAISASYALAADNYSREAAEGRRTAVSPLLPSNPVLSVFGGRRWQSGEDGHHWAASLSQELEIAGQREVRREAAQADIESQSQRVVARRREIAVEAWIAYFNAIAAAEELRLAGRLAQTAQRVATVARAKAEKGLLAPIDADIADAASVRVLQGKLAADRRSVAMNATLTSLLGLSSSGGSGAIEGELVPFDGVASTVGVRAGGQPDLRPEVRALDAERRAHEARAHAFRRIRVPNPTVTLAGETDRFEGHVFAVGLAFPIPIPGNVGRTYAGEIAEEEALSRRSAAERDKLRRDVSLQVTTARNAFESYGQEVQAFSSDRLSRAEEDLRALADELEAGRLAVRDAIVAQQAMIDLLQANVATRRAWCLASVELAFAAGLPLERGTP